MLVCFSWRANNRTANYSALCRYCIETCHWPPNMCNLKPPPVHQISGFETKHRNTCGHSLPPPQAPSMCLTALFLSHLHDLPSPPVLCSPSVWLWSSSFFLLLAETTQDNPRNESQSNITQHNMVMESYLNIKNIKKKPTWTDEAKERVVGGEAVVSLKPPIRATTRPLDGQHLWLHRTLSWIKTGQ